MVSMRAVLKQAIGALLILGTGCASFSTHATPRPTPKGHLAMDGNIDVLAFTDDDGERSITPNVELVGRYGLADTIDIGAKLNGIGLELNSRIALVLSDRFDLGIAPSVGFVLRTASIGYLQRNVLSFGTPLLAGVHVTESLTIVSGMKFYGHLSTHSATKNELVFYPGGVIGLELWLSEHFALFPELNVLFPYDAEHDKFAKPVWQGGVAFQFRFAS